MRLYEILDLDLDNDDFIEYKLKLPITIENAFDNYASQATTIVIGGGNKTRLLRTIKQNEIPALVSDYRMIFETHKDRDLIFAKIETSIQSHWKKLIKS